MTLKTSADCVVGLWLVAGTAFPAAGSHAQSPTGQLSVPTRQAEGPSRELPATVRLAVSPCDVAPFDLNALARALEVELSAYRSRVAPVAQEGRGEDVEPRVFDTPASDAQASDAQASDAQASNDGSTLGNGSEALLVVSLERCGSHTPWAEIRIIEPDTGRFEKRAYVVSADPQVDATRVLALFVSEALQEAWPQISTDEPASPPSVSLAELELREASLRSHAEEAAAQVSREMEALRAADDLVRQAQREDASVVVSATFGARVMPEVGGGTFARLEASWAVLPFLRVGVDGSGYWGNRRDILGELSVRGGMGGLSVAWNTASAPYAVAFGPRLEAGYLHVEGTPLSSEVVGNTVADATLLVSMRTVFRLRFHEHLSLVGEASVGHTVVGIDARAEDRRIAGMRGPVVDLSMGVAVH